MITTMHRAMGTKGFAGKRGRGKRSKYELKLSGMKEKIPREDTPRENINDDAKAPRHVAK